MTPMMSSDAYGHAHPTIGIPQTQVDEAFSYLDDLRAEGLINMFGATAYLMREFPFDRKVAKAVLAEWMRTFAERHP